MSDITPLAVTTVLIAVGGAEAARLVTKDPNRPHGFGMKPVIGGFILGLFLFAAGMVSEYLASLLCYLIIISSLLLNGLAVFSVAK